MPGKFSTVHKNWQVSTSVIIPAQPNTKRPMGKWATYCGDGRPSSDSLRNDAKLRAVWENKEAPGPQLPSASTLTRWENTVTDSYMLLCDVAIPGGLVVVDVDHVDKMDIVIGLCDKVSLPLSPYIQVSRNGGVHLLYAVPTGLREQYGSRNQCRNLNGEVESKLGKGKGLYDIKSYRAYIMAPGSKGYTLYRRDWDTLVDTPIQMTDEIAELIPEMPPRAFYWLRNGIDVDVKIDEVEENSSNAKPKVKVSRTSEAARAKSVWLSDRFVFADLRQDVPLHFAGLSGDKVAVDCLFCDRDAPYHKTFWDAGKKQLKCFGCMAIWTYVGRPRNRWDAIADADAKLQEEACPSAGEPPNLGGVKFGEKSSPAQTPPSTTASAQPAVELGGPYKKTISMSLTEGGHIVPPAEGFGRSSVITAGTGQGKTHQLLALREQAAAAGRRFLLVSPHVLLSQSGAKRLDLSDYTKHRSPKAEEWHGDVSTTLMSTAKLRFNEDEQGKYDIAIDEPETILRQLKCLGTDDGAHLSNLLALVDSANTVTICDAYAAEATEQFLAFTDRDDWCKYTSPRVERELCIMDSAAIHSAIFSDLEKQTRLVVYCASKADTEMFAAAATAKWEGAKVMIISETHRVPENVNWADWDVILYTASAGTGVDISVKNHFVKTYALVVHRSEFEGGVSEMELRQAIARVRNPIDPIAYVGVKIQQPARIGRKMQPSFWAEFYGKQEEARSIFALLQPGSKGYIRAQPKRERAQLIAVIAAADVRNGAGWLGQYLTELTGKEIITGKMNKEHKAERKTAKLTANRTYCDNLRRAEVAPDKIDKLIHGEVTPTTQEEVYATAREKVAVGYGTISDPALLAARSSAFPLQMERRVRIYQREQGNLEALSIANVKSRYGSASPAIFALYAADALRRMGYLVDGHVSRSSTLDDEQQDAVYAQLAAEPRQTAAKTAGIPQAFVSRDASVVRCPATFAADLRSRRKGYIARMMRLLGTAWEGIEEAVVFAAKIM